MPSYAGMIAGGGYAPGATNAQDPGEHSERGYRRRKIASMAGNLYRTGQQAVSELRESYVQSKGRDLDDFGANESTHIPGSFPDVAITSSGNEQLVLFPSYAMRHIKRDWTKIVRSASVEQSDANNEEWWHHEWEKHEDEKAIVDVDVRGWIYSPHVGPMSRRNRILIGLARQLSGIPSPRAEQGYGATNTGELKSQTQLYDDIRDRERIAQQAAVIEKRGQEEKQVALAGGYSEQPQPDNPPTVDSSTRPRKAGIYVAGSAPNSPGLSARQSSIVRELTEAELAVANANLMARVAPFLTNPLVAMPITIFFYNDTGSQSKTVVTDDAGHFNVRAALDFIPTHVRVLVNEKMSATQEVKITESAGVSLISDIDDTVKRSNISSGAKEIFRNTFVRDLGDLCIDGVREWYTDMHNLGVSIHYCSNSPWQLFPVLASFFKIAGLPPGSLHLKKYSGMLQGIFEPVAERKKSTLNRLMKDFPSRKFLLVGDSGEADLEVYTELALANPGRVLAIFIRDVTTPEEPGYFDSSSSTLQRKISSMTLNERKLTSAKTATTGDEETSRPGPVLGTLIDFSDEPIEAKLDEAAALAQINKANAARELNGIQLLGGRKPPPPPRPLKPTALRSTPMTSETRPDVPPPKPKRPQNSSAPGLQPPTTTGTARDANQRPRPPPPSRGNSTPPPPLPRRPGPKNVSPRLYGRGASSVHADIEPQPLPPSSTPQPPSFGFGSYKSATRAGTQSGSTTPSASGSPTLGPQGVNKKLELWRRRLARAHELLDSQGVVLYTWRTGHDVVAEAVGLVKQAQQDMEPKHGQGRRW